MILNKKTFLIIATFFFYSLSYSNSINFKNSSKQKVTVKFKLGQIIRGKTYPRYGLNISNNNISKVDIKSGETIVLLIDDLGDYFRYSSKQQVIVFPIVTEISYHGNKKKVEKFGINCIAKMLSKGSGGGKVAWAKVGSKEKHVHTGIAYLDVLEMNNKQKFDISLSINEGQTLRRIN